MNTSLEKVDVICAAGYDKKAEEIVIMDMGDRSSVCRYFVLMSAPSSVRVKSISEWIEDRVEEEGSKIAHREGFNEGLWVLLDFGDVIAHVFYGDTRKFYDLETLWGDAPKRPYVPVA